MSAQQMKGIAYSGVCGREVIEVVTRVIPTPGEGEVLIKVVAAVMNNADLIQRASIYPPPPGASDLPGLEVSGTIEDIGPGVTDWQVGAEVCALLAGGGYAEYVAVPAGQVLPIPQGLSLVQAAGIPEVAANCWYNRVMHAGVASGDWALVHGGTGGIGSFAVQLLKCLDVNVITTVGSDDKAATAQKLGADVVVNYKSQDFVQAVDEATDGVGVNVVLDLVGGEYLQQHVDALAPGGTMVTIGLASGPVGSLDLSKVMQKRLWLTGTTIRSQSVAHKSEVMRQVYESVWPMIAAGKIQTMDTRSFPLTDCAEAQDWFKASARVGKVLLTMN